MASIEAVGAREILDSRGNPTVEVEVLLDDGTVRPRGRPERRVHRAVRGRRAARRRRPLPRQGRPEGRRRRHPDRSVPRSIGSRRRRPAAHRPDHELELDGTPNKANLGANAILGASLAVAKAAAESAGLPLYRYVGGPNAHLLPVPMMNILNGGAHADSNVDVQEFMIAPIGAPTFAEALRSGAEVYHALKSVLKKKGLSTGLGDEGGFAPSLDSNRAALDLIARGRQRRPASPSAPTSRWPWTSRRPSSTTTASYGFEGGSKSARRDDRLLHRARRRLPDRLHRGPAGRGGLGRLEGDDRRRSAAAIQIVGDDLFVTNLERLAARHRPRRRPTRCWSRSTRSAR